MHLLFKYFPFLQMKAIHLAVRSQRNIWPIHCHPSWLVFCLIWFVSFVFCQSFPPQTLTQCKLNTVDVKFRVHALWDQHKLLLFSEDLASRCCCKQHVMSVDVSCVTIDLDEAIAVANRYSNNHKLFYLEWLTVQWFRGSNIELFPHG